MTTKIRVKLIAIPEEGMVEEFGYSLGFSSDDTIIVQLDEKYRVDMRDDLIREVATEDVLVMDGDEEVGPYPLRFKSNKEI